MTALAWVKLHTDILGDPKLMRAARRGAKGLEQLPWLIAFAARAGDAGRLTIDGHPAEPQDIAAEVPGGKAATVAACLASLREIGVLVIDGDDDRILRFAKWDERAGKPSDRPESIRERVQRHRQRKRGSDAATPGAPPPVTEGETPGNALHGVSPAFGNAIEEEEEEEGEEEERELPPAAPPAVAGARLVEAVGRDLAERFYRGISERKGTDAANAFLATATASLDGMHGPALSPSQLAIAITDYLANGEQPNLKRFRGYLRAAIPPPHERPGDRPPNGNGAHRPPPPARPPRTAIAAAPETKLR